MKITDIQKLHDTRSITGARRGGSKRWRIEYLTAQRGHSVYSNNPEEI